MGQPAGDAHYAARSEQVDGEHLAELVEPHHDRGDGECHPDRRMQPSRRVSRHVPEIYLWERAARLIRGSAPYRETESGISDEGKDRRAEGQPFGVADQARDQRRQRPRMAAPIDAVMGQGPGGAFDP